MKLKKAFPWIVALASSLMFSVIHVHAAQLYLSPDSGDYQPGDLMMVEIRIDTQKQCINSAEVTLQYPKEILESINFSQGNSIFTLWAKSPTVNQNNGTIGFIGGIPSGYCGRASGDPGVSNLLGKAIFRVRSQARIPGSALIEITPNSRVLLNDGEGTEAELTRKPARFTITNRQQPLKNDWTRELQSDVIPPESFYVEIVKDRSVHKGKYFAAFSTIDKQTGLDHYEVLEMNAEGKDPATGKKASWKWAESPYLLTDQTLQSVIKVKAVDEAGNVRMAEIPGAQASADSGQNYAWAWLLGLAAILVVLVRFLPFLA